MSDVIVNDLQTLIDLYACRIRRDVKTGGEVGYAHAFVEALTGGDARHSNARRLQQVQAVNAAAELVRAERHPFSPTAGRRAMSAVKPQVSPDSGSAASTPAAGRGGTRGE